MPQKIKVEEAAQNNEGTMNSLHYINLPDCPAQDNDGVINRPHYVNIPDSPLAKQCMDENEWEGKFIPNINEQNTLSIIEPTSSLY